MTQGLRAVAYFLLGFVLMLVLFGALGAWMTVQGVDLNSGWLYILFALQQLVTLVVIWGSMKKAGWLTVDEIRIYFMQRFTWKGWGLFWKRVVGGFVVYMLINGALFTLVDSLGWEIPGLYGDQSVMVMLQEMNITGAMDWIMTVLMIVLIGPLVEELVYRGIVTDALMQKRRRWGVALAAFIFALIHLEFAVFRNLFLLALILGVIYKKTGSMRYSFLFHVIINGMGIIALWLTEAGYLPEM